MTPMSKIIAAFLISTLTAGCCAAQRLSSSAQFRQRASGCHQHRGGSPAPAPNHGCCSASQDVAILQVSDVPRHDVSRQEMTVLNPSPVTRVLDVKDTSPICSADPPVLSSLRI